MESVESIEIWFKKIYTNRMECAFLEFQLRLGFVAIFAIAAF